ncbi:lysophospholipase [Flavobacterium sediminilitoris]|uniref:Lysophospholipase n=1 Tax=Flavobacterium sediminilitoris TaxID=2024526 RepID=A0ABY4HMH5_9FLAO|nr:MULTISPECIES: alpha/beta fold hydrolase [Flavobacterium]UOX33873.1 lysophospholipase [Flavobacterium sediminilitoris]
MKKKLSKILKSIILIIIVLSGLLYFFQEKIIFLPEKLDKNYDFSFKNDFEELNFKTNDNTTLNGLLFKAKESKGLVFYLHGNAGSLKNWGYISDLYTNFNYDIFILDYRGFGKSEEKIKNEEQLFEDNQLVYNKLKEKYTEKDIIVIGYSIGSGLAAKLASENNPKHLILQAPYYSLTDLVKSKYSFIPTFLLKYKIETDKFLKDCKMPITIFHGDNDNVIYYESSVKLKNQYKDEINFITLKGQNHNGINENYEYAYHLMNILKYKPKEIINESLHKNRR